MEYWTKGLKSLCYANKAKMMGDIISPTDKNIALLALLIFYTISSSPAEWALFWNGGRSLKKEHTFVFISKHKQQMKTQTQTLALPHNGSGSSHPRNFQGPPCFPVSAEGCHSQRHQKQIVWLHPHPSRMPSAASSAKSSQCKISNNRVCVSNPLPKLWGINL